jgi:O-6-methylguanine DNA methyltransferase
MARVHRRDVNIVVIQTDLGVFEASYTDRGICAIRFPSPARRTSDGRVDVLPTHVRNLAGQLKDYARGRPVAFRVPLDLDAGTAFQRKVWRALQSIPRGQTRSYGWIARKIGHPRAARAVGMACGANPVPIVVPCHRVIASDGSLGGFSNGLGWKKRLLTLETVSQTV